jgi:hypothetical protein
MGLVEKCKMGLALEKINCRCDVVLHTEVVIFANELQSWAQWTLWICLLEK